MRKKKRRVESEEWRYILAWRLSWLRHENCGGRRDLGFWVEGDEEKEACISNEKGRKKRKRERERREAGGAASPPGFSNRVDFALFALFFPFARATPPAPNRESDPHVPFSTEEHAFSRTTREIPQDLIHNLLIWDSMIVHVPAHHIHSTGDVRSSVSQIN
jgi:hypothetical protein